MKKIIILLSSVIFLSNCSKKITYDYNSAIPVYKEKQALTINTVGNIDFEDLKKIAIETTGVIENIYIKEGDFVKKNQTIATISNDLILYDYELNFSNYKLAMFEYFSKKNLLKSGAVSLLEIKKLENIYENSKINLKKSIYNKNKLTIKNKYNGVILYINKKEGEVISNYNNSSDLNLALIANVDNLKAQVLISDVDINTIKLNNKVIYGSLTDKNLSCHSTINNINYISEKTLKNKSDDSAINYFVSFKINKDCIKKFKKDANIEAKIIYDMRDIISIDRDYIEDEGDNTYVYILKKNNEIEKRKVEIQLYYKLDNSMSYEVLSGLKEGDIIIKKINN